jgi:hypothetical protein
MGGLLRYLTHLAAANGMWIVSCAEEIDLTLWASDQESASMMK